MTETTELERPWECEDCGLTHRHFSDIDHNLRGISLGPSRGIRELEYNERCHCGWHEMAHKIEENEVSLAEPAEEFILWAVERLPLPQDVEEEIYA